MKTLTNLIDPTDSGWQLVQDWISTATNAYQILPCTPASAEQNLLYLQITTQSPMGAIAHHTGGILIDSGWIRILGSGGEVISRSLKSWNTSQKAEGFLLIADDVVGGYFALNGGAFGDDIDNRLGDVYYFAPDTLQLESLGVSYSDFLVWAFTGNIERFYQNLRWHNWRDDMTLLNGNQVFSFVPFLWTAEGKDINQVSRKIITINEDYSLKQQIIN